MVVVVVVVEVKIENGRKRAKKWAAGLGAGPAGVGAGSAGLQPG